MAVGGLWGEGAAEEGPGRRRGRRRLGAEEEEEGRGAGRGECPSPRGCRHFRALRPAADRQPRSRAIVLVVFLLVLLVALLALLALLVLYVILALSVFRAVALLLLVPGRLVPGFPPPAAHSPVPVAAAGREEEEEKEETERRRGGFDGVDRCFSLWCCWPEVGIDQQQRPGDEIGPRALCSRPCIMFIKVGIVAPITP